MTPLRPVLTGLETPVGTVTGVKDAHGGNIYLGPGHIYLDPGHIYLGQGQNDLATSRKKEDE